MRVKKKRRSCFQLTGHLTGDRKKLPRAGIDLSLRVKTARKKKRGRAGEVHRPANSGSLG